MFLPFYPIILPLRKKPQFTKRIWNVELGILGLNVGSNISKLSDSGNVVYFLLLSFLICKDEIIICISEGCMRVKCNGVRVN